jgi:hypothetical protein
MAFLRELGFRQDAIDAIDTQARRYEEVAHLKNFVAGRKF